MKSALILVVTLFAISGCSLLEPKKATLIVEESGNKDFSSIYFKSPKGKFGYQCSQYDKNHPNIDNTTFSIAGKQYIQQHYSTIRNSIVTDLNGTRININDIQSMYKLASLSSILVKYKHVASQYELSFNNSVLQKFIDGCKSSYENNKQKHIDEIENRRKIKEQHKAKVKELIAKKLRNRGFKNTSNGGFLVLSNVLVSNKVSDSVSYFNFLESKNTAYYMDFSSYLVTQQINKSTYMLQHIIEVYGYAAPAHIQLLPIIFHSKKQLFEQSEVKPTIVIYKGVETYKNIYGQNKQAIIITEL